MAVKSVDYTGAPIWIDEAGRISYEDPANALPALPAGIVQSIDYAGTPIWANLQTGGFTYNRPTSDAQFAFDASPFSKYLSYAGYVADPESLFGSGYNPVSRNSVNPYFNTDIRDALRRAAVGLGLKPEDADRAALEFAQGHLDSQGQGYSDASSPSVIANDIAAKIFAQAGKPFEGLTPDERTAAIDRATAFQERNKSYDDSAWKRDEIASIVYGVPSEQVQSAWEKGTNDGLPSEQALSGADNPWNTWLQNKLRNEDYDPYGNEFGLATEEQYKQAESQGYDTGAAALLQKTLQQAVSMYLGSAGITGELTGMATSGVDPSYVEYGKQAKTGYDYYKLYQQYQQSGEVNPGALFNAATYATGKTQAVGDFNAGEFTGGSSPYNANSFFDESRFGSNQAGGNVYDENGNWMDGEYDQYGNFVPSDQTTFGNDYGAGYGQGNDIFGGGNLEQSNPELFNTIGGGGLFSGLGGLLNGLGSNPSLGSLLSGGGNVLNTGLALAPIAAAIQYARNQGPFDTSRLTALSDKYNPDAMAYQYDRNTEDQRRSLTSSLADRGVSGSSFGNMDVMNFNTNRELGRGALISQASLGGADIAQKILQAQIQERQLRNQMYGSALYSLGNVFGGKR